MTRPTLTRLACGLTLAALCGAAHSQVSVYGLIDLSAGRVQAPGGTAANAIDSGRMTTSHFGLKGTEDLGGGLHALFTIESFLRADTGAAGRFNADTMWSRNSFVGLSGAMGTVTLGRNTTSLFVQTLLFNPLGDAFGFSPAIRHYFTSGTTTGDTAWNDSVKYNSPRLGNLSLSAQVAAGEGNGGRNYALSAGYGSGDLGLSAAWQSVKKGATEADTTTWQLAGSYDFKAAKAFLQLGQVNNQTTGNDYRITGLGVSVPVSTAGKVLAQWGRISPRTGASRSTLSVGYDHWLSKRTDLYAVYMDDKVSGLSRGTNYALGIRHRF